jgi:hypothetical protein
MAVVAAMAVMLIGATAFATTDSAFAGGHGHNRVMRRAKQPARLMIMEMVNYH